jgi:hypothetical protein
LRSEVDECWSEG